MKYTASKIDEFKAIIRAAKLNDPVEFCRVNSFNLTSHCNGVGSEGMPGWARKRTTKFFRSIEASAAIHDLMYHYSNGSEDKQLRADDIFLSNCFREVDYRYDWYDLRRYIARVKVHLACDLLKVGGRLAWLEAFFEKQKIKKELKRKKKNKNKKGVRK